MKKLILLTVCIALRICSYAQSAIYYKVYFEANQEKMNELSKLISFDHIAKFENGFTGDFDENEKNVLLNYAPNAKVLIQDLASFYKKRAQDDLRNTKKIRNGGVPANFHLGSMGGFMTLNEAIQNLDSMVLLYPNLIHPKQSIGTTFEGRPIYMYKISDNPSSAEPQEHKTFFTGLHHAREPESMTQLVYFMWYLLENYNSTDSVVKHLVDDRELFFVPILNPDGYAYNESTDPTGGGMWRKNRRNNLDATFGIDLNRNYGYKFAFDNSGSSPNTASDTYRGISAFSENETQAMKNFIIANKFKLIMNYHAYGNWLINPYGYQNIVTADDSTFQLLANRFTVDNNYTSGTCFQTLNYLSNGSSDDWIYGEQILKPKMFAFTPEIGSSTDGFWPAPSQIIPLAQENLTQNILASWMSGPYIEIKRLTPSLYSTSSFPLNFNFSNIGLDTCLNVKAWFTSTDPNFISSDTMNINNLVSQYNTNDHVQVNVSNSTPNNSLINGRIFVKYNNFLFSDTASFTVNLSVGIQELLDKGIQISPNPTTGLICIHAENGFSNLFMQLKDMRGAVVNRIENIQGHDAVFDLRSMANGMYILEIFDGLKIVRTKLLKE